MILYHATSLSRLESIKKNGLNAHNKTHWEKKTLSNGVYLTSIYSPLYANYISESREDPIIFEVDVNKRDLLPDEDYLLDCFFFYYDKGNWSIVDNILDTKSNERLLDVMYKIDRLKEDYEREDIDVAHRISNDISLELYLYDDLALDCLKYYGTCLFDGVIQPKEINRYTILDKKILKKVSILPPGEGGLTTLLKFGKELEKITKHDIWESPLSTNVGYF